MEELLNAWTKIEGVLLYKVAVELTLSIVITPPISLLRSLMKLALLELTTDFYLVGLQLVVLISCVVIPKWISWRCSTTWH